MKPLRPYLYSAYYNWLIDNDYTPYLLINADYANVDVPKEFVKDGKIILNISPRSIGQYNFTDEYISFNARFQGIVRDVLVPFGALEAIYSQETGDGVMFQPEKCYEEKEYLLRVSQVNQDSTQNTNKVRRNSRLKLVK